MGLFAAEVTSAGKTGHAYLHVLALCGMEASWLEPGKTLRSSMLLRNLVPNAQLLHRAGTLILSGGVYSISDSSCSWLCPPYVLLCLILVACTTLMPCSDTLSFMVGIGIPSMAPLL